MNKVKKKKIIEGIIVFIISFLVLFVARYSADINDVDEMWTFSFSSKLSQGYMVYRDYNMLQTPLYAQITAIFLRVFGNTMLVSCIVGSVIASFIVLIQYLILKKLKVDKKTSTLIICFVLLMFTNIVRNSYNILALLFVYLTLFIEIMKIRCEKYVHITGNTKNINVFNKKVSYTFLYNIITGICICLAFLSKQTVGAYLVISITLYYFGQAFILKQKTFKKAFIELTQKACACIIVLLIELLWLYFNDALYQFIDYTVLGITSFANKNKTNILRQIFVEQFSDKFVFNVFVGVCLLLLPVMLYLNKKGKIKAKNKLDNNVLLISIMFFIIAIGYSFPLANEYHFSITKQMIIYLSVINIAAFRGVKNMFGRQMSKISYVLLISTLFSTSILNSIISYNLNKNNLIEPFQYMKLSKTIQNEILEMKQYIENFEKEKNMPIYIIDSEAVKFNLALNRNGGIFDLPLHGNLGHKDYNLIIEKLERMDNYAIILRSDDEDIFWQQPKEIKEYILKNLVKVDSVIKIKFLLEENKDRVEYIYDVYVKE